MYWLTCLMMVHGLLMIDDVRLSRNDDDEMNGING